MKLVVPYDRLRPETLQALIEEFVTRNGAVHGHADTPLQGQIESVRAQLASGKAVIIFDQETQASTICLTGELLKVNRQKLGRLLHAVLADLDDGASITDSDDFRQLLGILETFVPELLRENHPEWEYESLDGVLPTLARKTGGNEAEIFGECIIISDQTLTTVHLRLQVSASGDDVSWLECSLGERGEHGMVRTPYRFRNQSRDRVGRLEGRADMIDWVYRVTYGERRP